MEPNFSIVELKVKLHGLVREGCIDHRVIELLFDNGAPLPYERQLWDYKLKQPTHTKGQILGPQEKHAAEREWANLVKDIASFYNSYGGYILFGISDSPRRIVGYTGQFDVDELNNRVNGFTKTRIECSFRIVNVADSDGRSHDIGVLLVPHRPDGNHITLMRKDGPPDSAGKPLFPKGSVFLRKGDSCCRAEEPEDFEFLVSAGRRSFAFATAQPISTPTLSNNLPPRDSSFIRFVGREQDTVDLWNWLLDDYAPLRLVAGLGGVGKTTLVREFTENVVRSSPSGIEKVVWLSAKEAVFTAIQGKYELASRVDFTDVTSLLKAALLELGEPEANLLDVDKDDLLERLTENLAIIPAFLVVDDLDSLPLELQQEAFHCLLQAVTRAAAKSSKASKCLITARLDLGASPSQLMRVKGLPLPDFALYVREVANSIELQLNFGPDSQLMKRLHLTTEGSPTFASAVLRLVALGDQIEIALNRWKGSDGEEVRRFAFERELNNLTDSQIRVLYGASVLGECYLDELAVIVNTNQAMLRDTISELRKYHLVSFGSATAQGVSLNVPSGLQLMRDIVRKRVHDPKRIDDECARARSQNASKSKVASRITQRVIALWQGDDPNLALDIAKQGAREHPRSADLHCLLGRAYLRINPPNYQNAELAFREASNLSCDRPELLPLWIEAKYGLTDWNGILAITQLVANNKGAGSDIFLHRATAHRELAKNAANSGNWKSSAEWYRNGGLEINQAFSKGKAAGNVIELKELRAEFMSEYVFNTDKVSQASDEHLDVWFAVNDSFDAYVRRPVLLRLGFSRLASWWMAVRRRGTFDSRALKLVEVQIRKAREIIEFQRSFAGTEGGELVQFMQSVVGDIENTFDDFMHLPH
jgi:hypothetical protein